MASIIYGIAVLLQKIFCNDKSALKEDQQHHQNQHGQYQQGSQSNGYPGGQSSPYQLNNNYPPIQKPSATYNYNPQQQQQQHGNVWNGNNLSSQSQQAPPGYVNNVSTQPHNTGGDDEHYLSLRNQAREAADRAHQLFAQSQAAYQSGDGARAKQLSVEGKQFMAKKDQLNKQADDWIYTQNNKDSAPGEIDLHGLYVKEAIARCEQAISRAQASGQEELRIIVGKGNHSQNHVAKIGPAVQDLMKRYNLSAQLDPHNTGVLVVDLQGREIHGRTRNAGAVADELANNLDKGCTIM